MLQIAKEETNPEKKHDNGQTTVIVGFLSFYCARHNFVTLLPERFIPCKDVV
jgi:hypothetical protein